MRSNPGGFIGFLTDRRRLNVALTRAKDALIVVGNERTLRKAALAGLSRDFDVGRGGSYDEDEDATVGGGALGGGGSGRDPDADPGVWRRFLEWCAHRGLVRQWEEPASRSGSRHVRERLHRSRTAEQARWPFEPERTRAR